MKNSIACRLLALSLCWLALTSCAQRQDDVELKAGKVTPPAAYSSSGDGEPFFHQWADFDAYRNAQVKASKSPLGGWDGERAIPGSSLAIRLNEGSVLANTSAHPQYWDLWIQVPADLKVGVDYPLRAAALQRPVTRTKSWGDGSGEDRFGVLNDGEITLSGMQGYEVPVLKRNRGRLLTFTLLERGRNALRFRLRGAMPVLEKMYNSHYQVKVDRVYEAKFKPVPKT